MKRYSKNSFRGSGFLTWMITLLLAFCLMSADCQAQGTWSTIKDKAKSAWNSRARKNAWKNTKKVVKKAWNSDPVRNVRHKSSEMSETYLAKYEYTVPLTGRKFYNIVPDDKLLEMSKTQYRSYTSYSKLSSDAKRKAQVRRVGQRLANAVTSFYRRNGRSNELKNFNWEFNVVRSSEVNAFCMPGGKIVVYDGMFRVAKDDAMLAIVLGHEIAHAIAKHSAEQMTKKIITAVGLAGVYAVISSSDMSTSKKRLSAMIASAGATLATLKFSRIDETEADRIGLIISAMAGYDPEVAIGFWQRMGKESGNNSTHDFYSTHPSNSNRIANIRSFLPEAKKAQAG